MLVWQNKSCLYLSEFVTMTIQCGIVLQTVKYELEVMVFTIIFIYFLMLSNEHNRNLRKHFSIL